MGSVRPPAFAVLCAAACLTACGGGSGGGSAALPPAPNTVRAENFAFTPDTISVHVGDTVMWVIDQPAAPHNVVSLSGPDPFNSGVPTGKGTFRFTFTHVGTTTYTCLIHPNMKGTVTVTP